VPAVSGFSRAVGRPWVIEEFGLPADLFDVERARRYTDTNAVAARHDATGTGLWRMRLACRASSYPLPSSGAGTSR
jgi:hypothetical protein